MVSNIFYFHPYLGKISNFTNVFQLGRNHQPDIFVRIFRTCVFSQNLRVHLFFDQCSLWYPNFQLLSFIWGSPGMVKILRLSRMAKLLRAIPELSIVPRAVFVKKRKSQPGVVVVMAMCADFFKRFLQGFCTSLFLQGLNSSMFKILMDFSVHTLVDYTAPSNFSLTGHNEHFRSGNPQI